MYGLTTYKEERSLGTHLLHENQFWSGSSSRAVLVKKKFAANYEQKKIGKYFLRE